MKFISKAPYAACVILVFFFLPLRTSAETEDSLPIIEGEGITVQTKQTTNRETLSGKELEKFVSQDVTTILQNAFNLSIRNTGGYGTVQDISIRGFTSDRLSIYIDGILSNSDQSGEFNFSSINPQLIEKIEIDYSEGPGGAIYITTIKHEKKKLAFSLTASNTSHLPSATSESLLDTKKISLSLSGSTSKFRWAMNGFSTQANNLFYYKKNNTQTFLRSGNKMSDGLAQASLKISLPGYSLLQLSTSFFTADKNHSGPVTSPSPAKQTILSSTETVLLDIGVLGSSKMSAQILSSHAYSKMKWTDTQINSLHQLHTINFSTRLIYAYSNRREFSFEGAVRSSVLDSNNTTSVALTRSNSKAEFKSSTDTGFSFKGNLSAYIDHNQNKTTLDEIPQRIVPKFSISVPHGDTSAIIFSAYRAFNLPDINDTHWAHDGMAKGNPDLKPETGWGADVLYTSALNESLFVSISAYSVYYCDAILWQVSNLLWSPANIGKALYAGSDLKVRYHPTKRIKFSFFYGFLQTYLLTGTNTFASNKRIPYQPMHRLTLEAASEFPSSVISASLRYESARFTGVVNTEALDSYLVLDARVSKKIQKGCTIFLNAENLFAETYETLLGYPSAALQITAGCKLALDF